MKKSTIIGATFFCTAMVFTLSKYCSENNATLTDAAKAIITSGEYRVETDESREIALETLWGISRDKIREDLEMYVPGEYVSLELPTTFSEDHIYFTGEFMEYPILESEDPSIGPLLCEKVVYEAPFRIVWNDDSVTDDVWRIEYLYYTPHPKYKDYDGPVERTHYYKLGGTTFQYLQ